MMSRLAAVIDAHDWQGLPALLHVEFQCRFVHTGEVFDRDAWVRLNAEYPGFEHLVLQDCLGTEARAAGRSHVTSISDGQLKHFEVASFLTLRDGLIVELTEVWTEADLAVPEDVRPF